MLSNITEQVFLFIINFIQSLGHAGIAAGMLIESACIPLPSEVVLPLGGFMASSGKITLAGANLAAAAGSMAGSIVAYTAGFYGGRSFILKYGRYIFVSRNHFFKAEGFFLKHGRSAVLFGRLLPIIRTFISLPAGVARMDFKQFLLSSLLGALPWNFILIYLGYRFGEKYDTLIHPVFRNIEYVVAAAIPLLIAVLIIKKRLQKRV
jgi:membrane protein DedA with SNARE-associated domain